MELRSSRLILRPVSEKDTPSIHALHTREETDRYNTLGIPQSLEETKLLIRSWIIDAPDLKQVYCIETHTGEFIGVCGVNIGKAKYHTSEIWYKLLPEEWNKGYATEMVKCLLDFCFIDLKMHRIEAGCAEENVASKKVLEKSGFVLEGLKRKLLPIRGKWHSAYLFAILEEDYQNLKINESYY